MTNGSLKSVITPIAIASALSILGVLIAEVAPEGTGHDLPPRQEIGVVLVL